MKKIITTGLITAAIVLASGSAASAVSPIDRGVCEGGDPFYKSTVSDGVFTQAGEPNSSVTGGPGVNLEISTSTSYSVSGSITESASVTVDATVASVSADRGVTIGESKTGTTTNGGSWTVPVDYVLGRLSIGSYKYTGTTQQYIQNAGCVDVPIGDPATFEAPAQEWAFITERVQ